MFAKQIVSRVPGAFGAFARAAAPLAARPAALVALPARAFANEGVISSGASKLSRALEKEIKYENENYSQLEDIETFLNESGFAFAEVDGGISMTLKKAVGDKTIEVVFEARQPIPDDQLGTDEEDEAEEQGAGETENYCDFTIFITEGDGKRGMLVDATSIDTEISYNSVQMCDDVPAQKQLHRFERSIKQYAGPDFSTLDERIQTSLTEYLEGFGVNEHLGAFVECMSLDKDQRLYMAWLADLKAFIDK